jgi:hypothetical protein
MSGSSSISNPPPAAPALSFRYVDPFLGKTLRIPDDQRAQIDAPRQATLISLRSSQPAPSDVAPHTIFKRKRAVYNHEEKMAVCSVLQACEHNCNKAHAMLTKSGVQMGYKSVWRINQQFKNGGNASRARGRPTDHDFEKALMAKVTPVLDNWLNQDGTIFGNMLLQFIVMAGSATAREETFRDRQLVKDLKFSFSWAAGVLRRHQKVGVTAGAKNSEG